MKSIMKNIFCYIAASCMMMTLVSCHKETADDKSLTGGRVSFEAVTETHNTRTSIQDTDKTAPDYGMVSWEAGDKVKFVYENNNKEEIGYPVSDALDAGNIADGKAVFTAVLPSDIKQNVADGSAHLYAVYPSEIEVDYSDGSQFKMTVPAVQDGTFAHASIAVAKLDMKNTSKPLEFKNFCGLFRVTLTDPEVRRIVLSSKSDIAGLVNVTFTGPAVKARIETVREITVNVNGEGTYYIAVLPGKLDGVSVYAYDGNDNLIGDASTSATVVLERAKMRSMGTLAPSSYYFVKVDGTGDGSSWDNAANYDGLWDLMNKNVAKKVLMAAGTYNTESKGVMATGDKNNDADFTILGGYPADASGFDIAGRDASANKVIVNANSGNTANNRIWVLQRGKWKIDGITFMNAVREANDTGSALVMEANASSSFEVTDCSFENNSNTGTAGGGAVRISNTNCTMKGCTFTGNKAKQYGGSIYVGGTSVLSLENCTFSENTAGRGGAICINGSANVRIDGSTFKSNEAGIAGALYVNTLNLPGGLEVTDTEFKENSATNASNGGGAVGTSGDSKTYAGILSFANCLFDQNTAVACGGAVWANGASLAFTDCSFTTNSVTGSLAKEDGTGGGAIYSASSGTTRIYLNRCFLAQNNVSSRNWGHAIDINSETAYLGMNNCVVRAPWAVTQPDDGGPDNSKTYKGIGSIITSKGYTAVVNTTVYSQTGNPQITQGSKVPDATAYINDIIVNCAGTPDCFANKDEERYIRASYTLYTQTTAGNAANCTFSGCKSGVTFNALGWKKAGVGMSVKTEDLRDHIYVYDWSGNMDGYTKATFAQVKSELENVVNVGPDFARWLGDVQLKMDMRGVPRDEAAMWPGSYQAAGEESAGLENFNLR